MSKPMLMLLSVLLVTGVCFAQQPNTETLLRHENFIAFNADAGDVVRIVAEAVRHGYSD